MTEFFGNFHLLRPLWLLALVPAVAAIWMLARQSAASRGWEKIVDEHLLRVLLGAPNSLARRGLLTGFGALLILTIVALSGPTWSRAPQATYRAQSATVLILSLSPTMDAGDVAPSRLVRGRLKVLDILARHREGQIALIAYSGEPYVVSPLTEDAKTIAALVPVLSTDIMPNAGDKLSAALDRAGQLLAQANAAHGLVVVVTDSAGDAPAIQAAARLRDAGHRVSVLAVGLSEGAPVPIRGGGFLKDASGAIIVHKLDAVALERVASHGGGAFSTLSTDDTDLTAVLAATSSPHPSSDVKSSDSAVTQWRDEGPWLVLILIPLMALLFRRGWLVAVFVVVLAGVPGQSQAFELEQLWLRKDQQVQRAMRAEDYSRAAELADDPLRKGEALFRDHKYAEAAEQFSKLESADGDYNRGNALARAGRYSEALSAYESALRRIPNHADAKYNRKLIEELMHRNPPPKSQDSSSDNQQQQQQQQSKQQQGSGQAQSNPSSGSQDSASQDRNGTDARKDKGQGQNVDNKNDQKQRGQDDSQNGKSAEQRSENKDAAQAKSDSSDNVPEKAQGEMDGSDDARDREERQAADQWLGRVPDDPGGLLREKFRREYIRRLKRGDAENSR